MAKNGSESKKKRPERLGPPEVRVQTCRGQQTPRLLTAWRQLNAGLRRRSSGCSQSKASAASASVSEKRVSRVKVRKVAVFCPGLVFQEDQEDTRTYSQVQICGLNTGSDDDR